MRTSLLGAIFTLGALGAAGCEGCLGLDDYELVPPGAYTTTTTTTSHTGTGGAGGTEPNPCEVPGGSVFAAFPIEAGAVDGPCTGVTTESGGILVVALDAERGSCEAQGHILGVGATTTSLPALSYQPDGWTVAAGTYAGGTLELPERCDDGSPVSLGLPSDSSEALFLARFEIESSSLCTRWARAAGVSVLGALHVTALDASDDGTVAVAAGAAGQPITFSDGTVTYATEATVALARYSAEGSLLGVSELTGSPEDAVVGLAALGDDWLATGSLLFEQPGCHGCSGDSQVTQAAAACVGGAGGGPGGSGGNAGGSGGNAGGSGGNAGGSGGNAGGSGGQGGALPDGQNALLWRVDQLGGGCVALDTVGADAFGAQDLQSGHAISARDTETGCVAYWTGMAGRQAWPFDAADTTTSLADGFGGVADGFVARLDSSGAAGCGAPTGELWNMRFAGAAASSVVWGSDVAGRACGNGVVVTAVASASTPGAVTLQRCTRGSPCTGAGVELAFANADHQLLVMGIAGDGTLRWHGAFGPLAIDTYAVGGAVRGEPYKGLVLDRQDGVVVLVRTTGPIVASNVTMTSCPTLMLPDNPGFYALGLGQDGDSGRALCEWATRLGP